MTPTDANAGRPTPGRTLSVIQLRPIDGGVGLAATADLADFRETALADPRLAGLVVPIGRGELVAVRL